LIEHNNWRISERALKNGWRHLGKLPLQGVVDELKRYAHLPVEKQAFAFLLFNDQRRHLDKHFASLEQHQALGRIADLGRKALTTASWVSM
jgi:hypothetical protein